MELKLDGKLRVLCWSKNIQKYINFDGSKLCEAIFFFVLRELKGVKKEDILPLDIDFEWCIKNKENRKIFGNVYDGIFIVHKDFCFINISCKNIKESTKNGLGYNDRLKNLFRIILHELYHYFYFLREYNKNGRGMTPEKYNDISLERDYNSKLRGIKDHNKRNEIESNIEEEIDADEFAFRNLSYFENLYNCNSHLPGI